MTKVKILICAPAEKTEGGIDAVVKGIEKGFEFLDPVLTHKRLIYGKREENMQTPIRIMWECFQLINFIYCLISYKPSIVHIQTSFDKKTVLRDSIHLFFTKLFSKKIIIHAHGGSWDEIEKWGWLFKALSKYLLTKTNLVIVTSIAEMQLITTQYKEKVNIVKIDNPVYLPFEIKRTENNSEKINVIFASRIIVSKGINEVIEAADIIKDVKNVVFNIYGVGNLLPEIENEISKRNLKNVILKGSIPLNELIVEYTKGHVYLFPSYHKEGFPMALFFALGTGLPIIATKVRPLPDFLTEPENCLWVEDKNPKMLAEKLIFLLNNKELTSSMSKNNILIIKKFDPKKITNELFMQYKKLLN